MKQGRNVEVGGKAITNITPAVRGIRNTSIPLIMTPSETSSPASPLTKKNCPPGFATIPTMHSAVMSTPNHIGL